MTQTSKPQIPADNKTFTACEVDAQWNVDGDYFSRMVLTATDDMPSRIATVTMPEDAAVKLMESLALQLGYLVRTGDQLDDLETAAFQRGVDAANA